MDDDEVLAEIDNDRVEAIWFEGEDPRCPGWVFVRVFYDDDRNGNYHIFMAPTFALIPYFEHG